MLKPEVSLLEEISCESFIPSRCSFAVKGLAPLTFEVYKQLGLQTTHAVCYLFSVDSDSRSAHFR